jgi:hypothetical protein
MCPWCGTIQVKNVRATGTTYRSCMECGGGMACFQGGANRVSPPVESELH